MLRFVPLTQECSCLQARNSAMAKHPNKCNDEVLHAVDNGAKNPFIYRERIVLSIE